MMSQTYEAEQKQLEAEVITLRKDLEVQQRQNENIENDKFAVAAGGQLRSIGIGYYPIHHSGHSDPFHKFPIR